MAMLMVGAERRGVGVRYHGKAVVKDGQGRMRGGGLRVGGGVVMS